MKNIKSFIGEMKEMPISTIVALLAWVGLVGLLNFVIIIFSQLFISPQIVDIYADIFYKLGLGFGAMSAGLAGFSYLSGQLKHEIEFVRKKDYLKLYPANDFIERYDIVNRKGNINDLYLRDKEEKIVRHIGNLPTYKMLGWNKYPKTTLEDKDFDKYAKGDVILISGNIGD